jgi:hypothetical protein
MSEKELSLSLEEAVKVVENVQHWTSSAAIFSKNYYYDLEGNLDKKLYVEFRSYVSLFKTRYDLVIQTGICGTSVFCECMSRSKDLKALYERILPKALEMEKREYAQKIQKSFDDVRKLIKKIK